jgi:hypothetical protein
MYALLILEMLGHTEGVPPPDKEGYLMDGAYRFSRLSNNSLCRRLQYYFFSSGSFDVTYISQSTYFHYQCGKIILGDVNHIYMSSRVNSVASYYNKVYVLTAKLYP